MTDPLAYLARRVTPREEAADVWQLTLTTVWRKIDKVPRADDEALPWLFAVARGELANHRRGQARRLAATDRLRAELAAACPRAASPRHTPLGRERPRRPSGSMTRSPPWTPRTARSSPSPSGTASPPTRLGGSSGCGAVRKRLQRARERMASTLTLPGRSETEGTLREGSQARGESVPAH